MDAQKIQFMVSIQHEIDMLEEQLGSTHHTVIETKKLFQKLSQSEFSKKNQEKLKSENNIELLNIKLDTNAIRSHLEIRANPSIDYEFIKEERVKKQLIADNKRMENVQLNLNLTEQDRFYNYCVAAFLQIEELINYFFGLKYSYIDFLKLLNEKNPDRKYFQKRFSEVPISDKIFLFEKLFYHKKTDANAPFIYHESIINSIREVRNEELHRCNIIEKDSELIDSQYNALMNKIKDFNKNRISRDITYPKSQEEKQIEKQRKLLKFIIEKNYNLVRDTLIELSSIIKTNIDNK